jgi:cytochrome c553
MVLNWPLVTAVFVLLAKAGAAPAAEVSFRKDVVPIFQQACAQCHMGDMAMGKLRLNSEADILKGGASGAAIVAGKSADSLLVKRLLGLTDAPRMPMGGGPLSDVQVKLIRAWVDQGRFDQGKFDTSVGNAAATESAAKTSAQFAAEVRPILAARCYSCHGSNLQQNGLRLDSLEAILKGSDSGKVIVPGHSQNSRLISRLLAQERPMMPYGGPPLAQKEIATIRQWIDAGAPGPDSTAPLAAVKPPKHWSYVKPVRPALPQVKDAAWPRNPIDNFILARLEREGLRPAPEAPKSTLLRRVYLDLIGLPPSPKEVDAFVADQSPDAYEKVVDRLLASPRYGERWARPWLDLARYADSNGYEKDRLRTAWEYRDWVIRALNQDMPFREFTIEQIAGDMLPNPTHDQLIATGFNRNSMINQEGGIDIDEYYWYSLVDRVSTTASVWLGSTLACAECHNHKFDPFPQKDYYRFLAFFGNLKHQASEDPGGRWMEEGKLELPTPEQAEKSKAIRAQMAKLESALDTQTPELDSSQKSWETAVGASESQWAPLEPVRYESAGGATLKLLEDGSILATEKNPQADTYKIAAHSKLKSIAAFRLEALPDASLPHGGPGRDADGNFFLSDFNVEVAGRPVVWKSARADESQQGYSVENLIKKKPGTLSGWAVDADDKISLRRQAVFIPQEPIAVTPGSVLTVTMKHQMRHSSRNVGRFRLSVIAANEPELTVEIPARLRPILAISSDHRTAEQKQDLAAAYRQVAPSLDATRKQIKDLRGDLGKLGIASAMVVSEDAGFARPSTNIRERGTYTSKGELVYADVPSALGTLPKDAMPNRLGLAQWLVSDDNPLTARVTVNHFWETLFGHGLVETSEDFGTQGDPPTHPELLDWLATEFMQNGWSMKKIQRLMVTSASYREDSHVTPELTARDPYNKLYARGPRFRVEAEMVHDMALAESGLLSAKMYGPGAFPYQPEGVWDIPYNNDKWIESKGEDRFRRSIYTFMRRSAPYPSLSTYDAPSREFCTVRRVRTNTPLQALTSLNDPYFFDAARAMAKRMMEEGGTTPADRVRYGFLLTVSRKPSQTELEKVLKFYNAQPSRAASGELAAMTMVANVLMNTDEAITKE